MSCIICVTLWRVQETCRYLWMPMGVYITFLRHCADLEGQGCSVQYIGLFGVCSAYWNAFYSVPWAPPLGGYNLPPQTPSRGGGDPPPSTPPLRCAPTKRVSCLQKLMGWVLWIAHASGIVVVGMPLWLTSTNNASRLGYTLQTESHKTMKNWQKSQWG